MTHGPFRRAHEIDETRELVRRHRIGLVVPTLDDDLTLWAALAGSFASEGTHVAVSSAAAVALCHDRHVLCRSLNFMGIAAAPSWLPSQIARNLPMPLEVLSRTPRHGVEAVRVETFAELERVLAQRPDSVVQPHLEGTPFEVELCCDLNGRLLTVTPPEYAELAVCIASAVHLVGAVTVHGTLTADRPVVRGVSPRLSNNVDVSQGAGARVPVELVEMACARQGRAQKFGGLSAAMGAVA
jgi:hypothetical protein